MDRDEALRESNECFLAAFQAAPLAMVISRMTDGAYVDVNPAALRTFGYTRDEVIGKSSLDINLWPSPDVRAAFVDALKRDGEVVNREIPLRCKDGRLVVCVINARSLMLGRVPHIIFITEDVTRRRELESQLLRSQKLEAVGRLAGGVAHDFNNILTVVMGAAFDLRSEHALPAAALAAVEEIQQAAERATTLTRQLLAFSRSNVAIPEVVDAAAVVTGLSRMLTRLIGEDIRLVVDAPDSGRVLIDRGQLEQVIVNLVVNARDAITGGGTIWVSTALAEGSAEDGATPASWVVLNVRDSGSGMSAEVQSRLFEPFFTTKPVHAGTGLGLSTIHAIVESAGGRISIQSALGKGSSFDVWLPAVSEPATKQAGSPPQGVQRGQGKLVLVEDEPALRSLAARVLRSAGYTVLEASDGTSALELLVEHVAEVAGLVVDIVMPGPDGIEVARRAWELRPELAVLFMSGYTQQATFPPPDRTWTFIAKPFDAVGLTSAVHDILGRRRELGAGTAGGAR